MAAPSSAIGQFQIGVSPIGGPTFDWWQTVLSQYANNTTLIPWIDAVSQSLDGNEDVANWYNLVWNVLTAQGWGLDVWGAIVGVGRNLPVSNQFFGFEEASDPSLIGYNQAPYFNGSFGTSTATLSDNVFRQLVLAKAATNITDCSIPAINQILLMLFGSSGVCYCTDGGDMTMTYTFDFTLSPIQLSIVETSNVLPKPAGVSVTIVQV